MSKKKFCVVQYYRVELEVEAENEDDAFEAAMADENTYTVTATFDRNAGGPYVEAANIDTEVYPTKGE